MSPMRRRPDMHAPPMNKARSSPYIASTPNFTEHLVEPVDEQVGREGVEKLFAKFPNYIKNLSNYYYVRVIIYSLIVRSR
jgi:hypothetical protein